MAAVLGIVRGHKGALALAPDQEVVSGQLVDGFANCALADPVARGQVHLAGDALAGLPFAALQTLQDQALDLLVQRAEGGREGFVVVRSCSVNGKRVDGHGNGDRWIGQ